MNGVRGVGDEEMRRGVGMGRRKGRYGYGDGKLRLWRSGGAEQNRVQKKCEYC